MIRLYRQTPEGIERTTQVDAAEQHLDSVFWIDLLTPEPAEIKFVERLCGLEMPTYDEMREIEATSRLYTEDGARFMTTTVLSRVDTESPSLSEITFVLMGAKIITIRHSDSYSFRVFSHQLLRQKQISRDQVFTGLLETIVDRQADVLERFGAELDRLSKNIFRRDEPEGKTSKRVPVSSALRLTLQDLGRVGDLLTPSQSDLAQDIKDVAGQAEGMLDGLKGTAADVRTLLSQAQGLHGSLDSVLADGQAAISDASAKLTELIENLDLSGTQTQLSTLVDILGGDPAVYGQYFSELVQTSVEPVYPIANYGSAMAPFYSVLAIWVGGVILVALMKVHAKTDGLLDPKPWHLYFGRYLTFLLFNELQAAVIVTGDLFILGVQCENIGMFYLTGALTSFVFSLLIYSLAISFGDVGKAVVVVVMVLQIAGSSGTFPIELLPQVYRKIYHFFPFPYAIDAVRECLCGMYGNTWLVQIGYLMLFAVAALIIGLFVRKPFIGLNAFVEEKLEESELF